MNEVVGHLGLIELLGFFRRSMEEGPWLLLVPVFEFKHVGM